MRPFASLEVLLDVSESLWMDGMGQDEWREAFMGHPRIGDKEQIRMKLQGVNSLEGEEQSGDSTVICSSQIIFRRRHESPAQMAQAC